MFIVFIDLQGIHICIYVHVYKRKKTEMVPSLHEFFQVASCPLSVEKTDLLIQMSNSGKGSHKNYQLQY